MKLPANIARAILDRQALVVSRLLSTHDFVRHCKANGLQITAERLRGFEKLGILFPVIRIFKPDVTMKIKQAANNSVQVLGQLKDNENWAGETRKEIAKFGFRPSIYRSWIDQNCLWCPRTQRSDYVASIDKENERHEAFYSKFQIFELQLLLADLDWSFHGEMFLDEAVPPLSEERQLQLREAVRQMLEASKRVDLPTFQPIIAQLISNRYLPQALSDRRTIRVAQRRLEFPDWDWYKCVDEWRPSEILDLMQMELSDVENLHNQLINQIGIIDPIANWQDLVQFISVEKRLRLKGDALRAESFRQMAAMLEHFYSDLSGSPIPCRRQGRRRKSVEHDHNIMKELEYVTNSFHINPRPRLTLVVEGETEEEVFPIIFSEVFGGHNSLAGIEIINLQGVENIVGSKHDRRTAIVRLVDYLHHHQTICFILLDNEGSAKGMKQRLLAALSSYRTGRRVTRYRYLKIWNKSFEYDNFSDTEIAAALSELSGSCVFKSRDVKQYRKKVPPGNLKNLFNERMGGALSKPTLGRALVRIMLSNSTKRKIENRPIVELLERVWRLALLNHRPSNAEIEDINQLSGHLGALTKSGRLLRRRLRRR